jgi:FtsH-binding integral membrane protein
MKKGFSKMFGWLFIGLLVTFGIGYLVSAYPIALAKIFTGKSFLLMIVVEFAIAIFFSARLSKMSATTAKICYLLYSIITGFTFGLIFLTYELMSIISVFFATSLVFGLFALIGYKTKKNLSKMSMWLFMSLIAVMIVSIVNIFLKSSALEFGISILFILIFLGYVVFDMKNAEALMEEVGEEKGAVYGAFQLYLDFINLFIELLKFLGKLKDD